MMRGLLLVLALAVPWTAAAQEVAPDVAPDADTFDPPPPMSEDPADRAPPADDPAPPPADAPAAEAPAPRADVPPEEGPADGDGQFVIDYSTLAAQVAAGVGSSLLLSIPLGMLQSVLSFIPGVNVVAIWLVFALRYAATGTVVTVVGDTLSDGRGVILWPALASALTSLGCGAVIGVVVGVMAVVVIALVGAGAFGALYALTNNPNPDPNTVFGALAAFYAAYGLGLLSIVGVAVGLGLVAEVIAQTVGAVVYQYTAEPKYEDDDGSFQFPGVLEPNHPPPPRRRIDRAAGASRGQPAPAWAMAF